MKLRRGFKNLSPFNIRLLVTSGLEEGLMVGVLREVGGLGGFATEVGKND